MAHFTQDDFEKIKRRYYLLLQCMRRRREGTRFELEEKQREIEILNNLTLSEYNKSRVCGLENIVREDFIIYDFRYRTRVEQELSVMTYVKGGDQKKHLRLLRSTYE